MLESLRDAWPEMTRSAAAFSPYAIELSALSEEEVDPLVTYLGHRPALPFRYVSVHAPTKNRSMPESELIRRLGSLSNRVRTILTHPDVVEDATAYRRLGRRLCFENLDSRKSFGITVDDLHQLFDAVPEAGFVFDIAHAHEADPSMRLASDLLDRFRGRLRHVHLSSIREGRHVPLTPEDETLFLPLLRRCLDVPWILEAAPPERWRAARNWNVHRHAAA